jgi:SAM-dependent methyltransferase
MPVINADTIRKLVLTDNELFVPERITKAIGQSVVSSTEDVSDQINRLIAQYRKYIQRDEPTPVDYSGEATIDAYTVNYLPRSTLIPKLLFLSLAYHPAFQTINDELNILDLGSGTGGVVLGLLDLFEEKPFSGIKANIVSCEKSKLSLDRQKELLTRADYKPYNVQYYCNDVADAKTFDKYLSKFAPYDYIIASSLFVELSPEDIGVLLSKLPSIMASNGVLLVADPPRTYVDKLKISISKTLRDLGLSLFYPCPPGYECPRPKCKWVWLDFRFTCPDIEIDGELLGTNQRLQTTWSIFCRSKHSIYDVLQTIDAELTWGVSVPIGDEFSPDEEMKHSICTANGPLTVKHTRKKALFRDRSEVILRGSIFGFNDDFSKVRVWHPLHGLEQRE